MDAGVLQLHGGMNEFTFDEEFRDDVQSRPVPSLTRAADVQETRASSLIIPTFLNRQMKNGVLALLLQGIEESRSIQEIVLVRAALSDHASSPEADFEHQITAQLTAAGKLVKWIDCEPNRRGAARNLGAAAASGELLVFLDDDMLLTGWRLVDVVASRMLEENSDAAMFPPRHYVRFPAMFQTTSLETTISGWRKSPLHVNRQEVFDPIVEGVKFQTMGFCFPGCFMVIRREAYLSVGGFADFEGWGFEDTQMALEAARKLNILNLFRICEPLLHIDHPVTPYKSWEFGTNKSRFFRQQSPEITAELHRRVLSGRNLSPTCSPLRSSAPEELLSDLIETGVPSLVRSALPTLHRIADERAIDGMSSDPSFVLLTGSRGRGTHRRDSDFDLLLLYRHGLVREFIVTDGTGANRVDVELADLNKFETIAGAPAAFGYTGVLELSKLAGTRLLKGDAAALNAWIQYVLRTALETGRAYWLLFLFGLARQPEKLSGLPELMTSCLRLIVRQVAAPTCARDLELLELMEAGDQESAMPLLIELLDVEVRDWRNDMTVGSRAFANQVPEIWLALHQLFSAARTEAERRPGAPGSGGCSSHFRGQADTGLRRAGTPRQVQSKAES